MRESWRLFSKSQPFFVTTYVAYHFYRSHNWCVKSGLKLGVEFVLYKKGPEYFHAQYATHACGLFCAHISPSLRHAVIVLNAEAETKREQPSLHSRSWASVLNVNRVSEQVAKVHRPYVPHACVQQPYASFIGSLSVLRAETPRF